MYTCINCLVEQPPQEGDTLNVVPASECEATLHIEFIKDRASDALLKACADLVNWAWDNQHGEGSTGWIGTDSMKDAPKYFSAIRIAVTDQILANTVGSSDD